MGHNACPTCGRCVNCGGTVGAPKVLGAAGRAGPSRVLGDKGAQLGNWNATYSSGVPAGMYDPAAGAATFLQAFVLTMADANGKAVGQSFAYAPVALAITKRWPTWDAPSNEWTSLSHFNQDTFNEYMGMAPLHQGEPVSNRSPEFGLPNPRMTPFWTWVWAQVAPGYATAGPFSAQPPR